jgi:uncharacterized integral membrane protein (TIGR00698 family)
LPGLLACVLVAAVATAFGRLVPVVGAPVFGIIIGVAVGQVPRSPALDARLRPGIAFSSRTVLQSSIVLLGTGLSLAAIAHTGLSSLPVMLGTLSLALAVAWAAGRLLGIGRDLRTLIGVGTGICGASAIAATTAVIGAAESDVAYAISTIFAFNVIAVLTYPTLGHLLGLSQHAFGLWAGTAINDTSSVIAAAYTYGHAAGDYGVVVKLTRTLMIIPISLVLAFRMRRDASGFGAADAAPAGVGRAEVAALESIEELGLAEVAPLEAIEELDGRRTPDQTGGAVAAPERRPRLRLGHMVPWFLIGFLLAAGVNTAGLVPPAAHAWLSAASLFFITMALAGIGLSTRPLELRRAGLRPLALGAILWATVGVSSLVIQAALGLH